MNWCSSTATAWDRGYEPWYRDAFERELTAVDGVEEALDRLGLPHCVASSGSHARGKPASRPHGLPGCMRSPTPAERLAGPGTTVFFDMRELPDLIAAGRPR